MTIRKILSGALAYLLIAFPLARLWHLVVFRDMYASHTPWKDEEYGT